MGRFVLVLSLFLSLVAQGTDWATLNERARIEALKPVKPGVPGKSPFWNVKARAFIHPPAFDFKSVAGTKTYRFTVTEKANGKTHLFTAEHPWTPLTPVWGEIAPGYVTVKCEGLGADGAVLGVAGTRECYRAAFFKGPYPQAADRDYAAAAHRCFASVYRLPQVQGWLTQDSPPEGYDLYCYPSKILSSMINALLRFAERAPSDEAAKAVTIARRMADWLIAASQPEGTSLEYLPPTYWGDRRDIAVKYAGMNMLLYPVNAANAYFALYAKTGEARYRDAGLRIAGTMRKIQNADGTWPLKVREKDGKPVRDNRLVTRGEFDRMFAKAAELSGDHTFAEVAARARRYENERIYPEWNWDGQFEDIDPLPRYHNLTKHNACDFAGWLFDRGRTDEAKELLAWAEDQFVVWSDPIHHMDWQHWKMPTALEQYEYYTPIDASMARFIEHFAKAYDKTGDALYFEKACALADCVLRHQRKDGTIPTYFDTRKGSDWVNCMVYTATTLEKLAKTVAQTVGTGDPSEVQTVSATAADSSRCLMASARPLARTGTQCEQVDGGVTLVRNEGTYRWPGISFHPAEDEVWNLSAAGVIEVTVSNASERAEMIHATVLGRDFGMDRSPAQSALVPPHQVRTISVQLADAAYRTDLPVKLTGMRGVIGSKKDALDFSKTTSVDVYHVFGANLHKSAFAVLDIRTRYAARMPKVIAATNFFPFVDRYGQFKHGEWKGKIHCDEEFQTVRRREEAWLDAHAQSPIPDADAYGGWKGGPKLRATGFFRTEKVGGKWWLVDPEGHLFFSLGVTCVYADTSTPQTGRENYFEVLPKSGEPGRWWDPALKKALVNFSERNLVIKYGRAWKEFFAETAHRRFRAWGINTIGNWSHQYVWEKRKTPYVATVDTHRRPVPDGFDPQYEADLRKRCARIAATVGNDPWCVGVFVDNELDWTAVTNVEKVAESYFSTVERVFRDEFPNHLYLGCRFARAQDAVWRAASRHCDVVSYNFYERHPTKDLPDGSEDKPLIVGEFHFGARDRGLLNSACSTAFDQDERAECFKGYVNACLDHPRMVGCHWFQYTDQALTGRPDGENFQIGFVSVCDFPYPEIVKACRETAAQMYQRRCK